MKFINLSLVISILLCALPRTMLQAQTNPELWKTANSSKARTLVPMQENEANAIFELNPDALQHLLSAAPQEFSLSENKYSHLIDLPFPDGSYHSFEVTASPIIAPKLLAKYPNLQTYTAVALDNPSIVARLDYTTKGFHAMIKGAGIHVYIDPLENTKLQLYHSYDVKTLKQEETEFKCHVAHEQIEETWKHQNTVANTGDKLRTFRLAIATTGEYTQFHGGTKEAALSAVVSTLNRVNLIFEQETSTRFILVEKNDQLIFTNPETDPFTNNSLFAMMEENQATIDDIVGLANYDVGHVFGTKGGGLASIAGVCSTVKSWGGTGLSSPVGDAFDVVYVVHELGHQLGAPHTFNSCNGNGGGSTPYEPGSGTSLMAYAGLCGTDNIQLGTDFFFHVGSYERIVNHGASCAETILTNNTIPSVQILDAPNVTIPISTPFELTGMGSDADGNSLTYTWDQVDVGPICALGSPEGNAPSFRFRSPSPNPIRVFPDLEDLIQNRFNPAEVLPTYSRDLNFRMTVRDNQVGNGGLSYAAYHLSATAEAGPFLVTSPNTGTEKWQVGSETTVTWEVAHTNLPPVNCSTVAIYLSRDGGLTYPTLLAENVNNTGTAQVQVPALVGTKNRIKIKGEGNVFFDISNADFEILGDNSPSYLISTNSPVITTCASQAVTIPVQVESLNGFDGVVLLSTSGLPVGLNTFSTPTTVNSVTDINLQITGLENVEAGLYPFTLIAQGGGSQTSLSLELEILASTTTNFENISPSNGAIKIPLSSSLEWTTTTATVNYQVEIATNPSFENILWSTTTLDSFVNLEGLEALTVYYWRLRAEQACGFGDYSPTYAFQTISNACQTFEANDLPLPISTINAAVITSSIHISNNFMLTKVRVPKIKGQHSFVSDLSFALQAPDGERIQLSEPICGASQNFNIGFEDEGAATSFDCPPTIGQIAIPHTPLSTFKHKSSQGEWQLIVEDLVAQDGGLLEAWTLELCQDAPLVLEQATVLSNNELNVERNGLATIDETILAISNSSNAATETNYVLRTIPNAGVLKLTNENLRIGDVFTQADINAGKLAYQQDGSNAITDEFVFDVFTPNGGWLVAIKFGIKIGANNLAVEAQLIEPLLCYNETRAKVALTPAGGLAPYTYSVDGVNFQTSNIFSNLGSGLYKFWVKDAFGLLGLSQEINIINPNNISVSTDVVGDQIIVTASGGTETFQYSLDGVNFGLDPSFSNLENGFYTVVVQDENGCRASATANVLVNNLEVLARMEQGIQCADSADGKILAEVTGGSPPYLYSIDGVNFQETPEFDKLGSGNYTVLVEEFEGFSQVSAPVLLEAPAPISLDVATTLNEINISASGGTGALLYSMDGFSFQSSPVFSNIESGTHTVFVQDANGCISSSTVAVAYEGVLGVGTLVTPISCFGEADAAIQLTAIGGTAPYQYRLGENTTYQSTNLFKDLGAGTYSFSIQDANGLSYDGIPIVVEMPLLLEVVSFVSDNTLTAIASGGTGVLQYQLNDSPWQASNIFEALPLGDYTVLAKDEQGCLAAATVTINSTAVQNLSATAVDFKLYPNPTDGQCTIELEHVIGEQDWLLRIEDIQGKVLRQELVSFSSNRFSIDVSAFAKGIYQVRLSNGKVEGFKRFVRM